MSAHTKAVNCFYLGAAVFAALASYRMHIQGIEADAFPIFEAITDLQGRAPDQYRILPYLLLGALQDLFSLLAGVRVTPRYPIIAFDAAFLLASMVLLERLVRRPWIRLLNVILAAIYPYLMFDGYRPIASFILTLGCLSMLLMTQAPAAWRKPAFVVLLIAFAFTRADVALLFAVVSFSWLGWRYWQWAPVLALPVIIQLLLSRVLFPDAVYFSPLVMLADNLSGRFLAASPLSYLLLGTLVICWRPLTGFARLAWGSHRLPLLSLIGYGALLFVIARPNEYRLFLPMLPIVLVLVSELYPPRPTPQATS